MVKKDIEIYGQIPSILCSNPRAPVAQLVRTSDYNSEDPGSNPGWISMSFFTINNSANKTHFRVQMSTSVCLHCCTQNTTTTTQEQKQLSM